MADGEALESFGVTITFMREIAVVGVAGELDLVSAPSVKAILGEVIDGGHTSVVLDLAQLRFMGAAGLEIIATCASRLAKAGGELAIRTPSALVVRLLEITGLTEAIRLEGPFHHLGPEQSENRPGEPARDVAVELVGHVRQVTAIPADDDVVDGALRLVVALARATVGGADGVSVSLRRHGRLATVAASDQTILDMDASQYATGEGPCVDASVEGRWFHIESLDDETRWPAFVPTAKELGINAILSSPLLADGQPVGALNIYSRNSAAFAPKDQELAAIFATEASTILKDAGAAASDDQLTERLQDALVARGVIAQAQGVLMERGGISPEAAFAALRRFSQETNTTLRDRSAEIVASAGRYEVRPFDQDAGPRE
jgi:anti-anti-sigma factor